MAEDKKKYNFEKIELRRLTFLENFIASQEGYLMGNKNEYAAIISGALKRCGLDAEQVMKEGKKINIDLEDGIFEVITPEKKVEAPKIIVPGK
jgi:hypothetical protein